MLNKEGTAKNRFAVDDESGLRRWRLIIMVPGVTIEALQIPKEQ